MVGVPKSLVTTGAAAVPSSVTNQTIYITGIHNAHSGTATIKENASDGTVLAKVKSGTSFTPAQPIKLGAEKKIYSDVTDVTVSYVVEGGPAITGPNGYPWGTKSNPNFEVTGTDNFGGPYAYSY